MSSPSFQNSVLLPSCLLLLAVIQSGVAECLDEDCPASIELLQKRLEVDTQEKPIGESMLPLAWVHVPKCAGTSFVNVLVMAKGVCPDLSDESVDLIMNPPLDSAMHHGTLATDETGSSESGDVDPPMWENNCNVMNLKFAGIAWNDHSGIGEFYEKHVKGHGAILVRQPEQRIISAYNFYYHDWPEAYYQRPPADLLEYAHTVAGCTVKMLTRTAQSGDYGHDATVCGSPERATEAETDLAVQRLQEGFPYVGIVEDYDLSVCLLHKMFGDRCKPSDISSSSNSNTSASVYDVSQLDGFRDLADGKLYSAAQAKFQALSAKYGVSMEGCAACFADAGYSP